MDSRGLLLIVLGSVLMFLGIRGTYANVAKALKPA